MKDYDNKELLDVASIREKFKEWYEEYFGEPTGIKDESLEDDSFSFVGYQAGYKSRDKEIHKYEQIATENSDWFDCLKIDFDKQTKEIVELNIACNEYKQMYVAKMAEIKYKKETIKLFNEETQSF